MEIIVRNLPPAITEKQVERFFRPLLANISINAFGCRSFIGRSSATSTAIITIPDIGKAQEFLELYGQSSQGGEQFGKVNPKLYHMGKPIYCSKSYQTPDRFLLRSLEKDECEKRTAVSRSSKPKTGKLKRSFRITALCCGQWDYVQDQLVFMTHFRELSTGVMLFGRQSVIINLHPAHKGEPSQRVEMPYFEIQSFTIGNQSNHTATFSLSVPPKMFRSQPENDSFVESMRNLGVGKPPVGPKRMRIMALREGHEVVVSSCLCYRVTMEELSDIPSLQALKRAREIPESRTWHTHNILKQDFPAQLTLLNQALSRYPTISFDVKFQLQRLAQNGVLPPAKVAELLTSVIHRFSHVDNATLVASIRKLYPAIPYAGPETEAADFGVQALSDLLAEYQKRAAMEESYSHLAEKYEHIALIHKATVTPVGILLSGPEPEIMNRVIRKYRRFSNYFLQVSFLDENLEPLRYHRENSNEEIYHQRFKKVLEGVINIAGRGYEFLGFSHSSLRSQACWFMAPFTLNGELLHARLVIKRLGDFSKIRSPAKCAARIGQAFSQTFSSIRLPSDAIKSLPDVEVGKRVFSDGVGTCSHSVMKMIWKEYSQSKNLKPTVFQVRFKGAKGMISLDSTLQGDALCLRPSMIKFEGTGEDIEICGAGLKPLPMYLNRPLIKILEDRGVEETVLLDLQATAIEKLRMTTTSPINAANFLQKNLIGKAARFPWLIRKLMDLDILFNDDDFLRNALELVILVQLRELKHKSRILVEEGLTVYGIMDETGFLQEGQVYIPVQTEDGSMIVEGRVVVTRSPALHPGDVQLADAIDVPKDSPLRQLHNCLVFSSKGERDLPSQLSGGDLDGDLYNIIYMDGLYPSKPHKPAEYPIMKPIDIGREVTRSDMTDFFIRFMENDQLGRIAVNHQILADQRDLGTFDPDCIFLAGLHSTAVDFSKTGIPVDLKELKELSRFSNTRPDFQAPGPRVLIEDNIKLHDNKPDESDDNEEIEETSLPRTKYYESHRVLGKLYRAIDEHKIFERIQQYSRAPQSTLRAKSPIGVVWKYVENATALIEWKHYREWAKDIKEAYEENLISTMIEYSSSQIHYLSEVEVFCGHIVGKDGAPSKRQRDTSVNMKEKHERDVAFTVACITQGEHDDHRAEALERSIACLAAALTARVSRRVGRLVSFRWIAAAVCLREVDKFRGTI
ncbi:hypothetical protein MMC07_008095 [Pseudocyphellaria aurata]|nr:hypothetical protein [Pseudocyphellaria aurata]